MYWYRIDYTSGGPIESATGTYNVNLDAVINSDACPKFIKLENHSYYSKLSGKYELFDKWDSKYANEILIRTDTIVSVRKLEPELLDRKHGGEWDAISQRDAFCIMVSPDFLSVNKEVIQDELLPELQALLEESGSRLAHSSGGIKCKAQTLLNDDEYVITSFGEIILRRKTNKDLLNAILSDTELYLEANPSNKEDE